MEAQPATASPLVHRYTLDEFWELPDPNDGSHYELIDGVLYVVPPPGPPHHMSASRLNAALAAYCNAHPERCVLFVPRAAIWTGATYLEPDLFLVRPERLEQMRAGKLGTADLVVEIMSPGSAVYDRTAKADTYAALGIQELWLVDPQDQRIEQRVLRGTAWQIAGSFAGNAPLRAQVFPGLEVTPAHVFS